MQICSRIFTFFPIRQPKSANSVRSSTKTITEMRNSRRRAAKTQTETGKTRRSSTMIFPRFWNSNLQSSASTLVNRCRCRHASITPREFPRTLRRSSIGVPELGRSCRSASIRLPETISYDPPTFMIFRKFRRNNLLYRTMFRRKHCMQFHLFYLCICFITHI